MTIHFLSLLEWGSYNVPFSITFKKYKEGKKIKRQEIRVFFTYNKKIKKDSFSNLLENIKENSYV